ncbi:hypothetical protein ACA910_004193 [Epithemia clementina (nom. ined.)]
MTEADVAAAKKKARPRPPKHASKGNSSALCGLKILLPLLAGVALCLVVFLYYDKSNTAIKVASKLDPLKAFLNSRMPDRKASRKNKKKDRIHEDAEMLKHRMGKVEEEGRNKKQRVAATDQSHHVLLKKQEELPLYKFESLRYALLHCELVLLYFAASWCPMSSPITEQLDSLFREILVTPPNPTTDEEKEEEADKLMQRLLNDQRQGVSLVYVSSDHSKEEMENYQKENWMVVPYESPDRNNLKKHFKTCAKNEMDALGMDSRDREIPALIVLSGASHEVLTFDGVQDIKDRGQQAVDRWLDLLPKNQ